MIVSAVLVTVAGDESDDSGRRQIDTALGERSGADLRAGQVGHHGDVTAEACADLANHGQSTEMVLQRDRG